MTGHTASRRVIIVQSTPDAQTGPTVSRPGKRLDDRAPDNPFNHRRLLSALNACLQAGRICWHTAFCFGWRIVPRA